MNKLDYTAPIKQFLMCETPDAWIATALKHQDILLIDHAHCEKKAASSALNMMYRYPSKTVLLQKMSRLAREELRHFEQVLSIMQRRNITFQHLPSSSYAATLIQHVRAKEPDRLVDSLIIGAIIEARSCERFAAIAPYLDEQLAKFYTNLLRSESRHFEDYLHLANLYSPIAIEERTQFFLTLEKNKIQGEDSVFRFHSGIRQ